MFATPSSSNVDLPLALDLALAMSAVVRGDALEFETIIDRRSEKEGYSVLASDGDFLSAGVTDFTCNLVEVVGKFGNADITKVLIACQHRLPYTRHHWLRGTLAAEAAVWGNREGLKVLIKHLQDAEEEDVTIFPETPRMTLSHRLRGTFFRCFQASRFDMVDFILEQCGTYSKDPDLQLDILMQAVDCGSVTAVDYASKIARSQINRQAKAYNYHSPLFFAFFTLSEYNWSGRSSVMKALLENGADSQQPHLKTKKTILKYAIERRYLRVTDLLLDHETKLYGKPSALSGNKQQRSFWLRFAFAHRCFRLIELLFRDGVTSFSRYRSWYRAIIVEPKAESPDPEDSFMQMPPVMDLSIHLHAMELTADPKASEPCGDCICPWCIDDRRMY